MYGAWYLHSVMDFLFVRHAILLLNLHRYGIRFFRLTHDRVHKQIWLCVSFSGLFMFVFVCMWVNFGELSRRINFGFCSLPSLMYGFHCASIIWVFQHHFLSVMAVQHTYSAFILLHMLRWKVQIFYNLFASKLYYKNDVFIRLTILY